MNNMNEEYLNKKYQWSPKFYLDGTNQRQSRNQKLGDQTSILTTNNCDIGESASEDVNIELPWNVKNEKIMKESQD